MFSGSYSPSDVQFLLQPLANPYFVGREEKERLIQSGQVHYSQMLSREHLPTADYMALFEQACQQNGPAMAQDCLRLALYLHQLRQGPLTLVSLARAGTPVGVVLKRLLEQLFKRRVVHYCVSILRDKGLDTLAMQQLLQAGHSPESVFFIDGWTGKGVIAAQLKACVQAFNTRFGVQLNPQLYTLVDLAGVAGWAASSQDYLIPSCLLNATVSGLISRTLAPRDAQSLHGCYFYQQYAAQDCSNAFVNTLTHLALQWQQQQGLPSLPQHQPQPQASRLHACLARIQQQYQVTNSHLIKPGIGEATRVLLRRQPRALLLQKPQHPAVAHLQLLARQQGVPVVADTQLPFLAVSLIRSSPHD